MAFLNRQLDEMVLRRRLNPAKQQMLIDLKAFVDRLAGCNFTPIEEVRRSEEKYGVAPDIITWGDFFQIEMAVAHWEKSDSEFNTYCQTVYYDLISAAKIFTGRSTEFRQSIIQKMNHNLGLPEQERNAEEIHLGILCHYFENLSLDAARLKKEDISWFHQFLAQEAV